MKVSYVTYLTRHTPSLYPLSKISIWTLTRASWQSPKSLRIRNHCYPLKKGHYAKHRAKKWLNDQGRHQTCTDRRITWECRDQAPEMGSRQKYDNRWPHTNKSSRTNCVSASHLYFILHSVDGNAPTVLLSTIRIVVAILPAWMQQRTDDTIIIFYRDVIKAFIQSMKSQRLIIY